MARPESAIPVGTQFSPALIDLPGFVAAILANAGNKAALEDAVWKAGVRLKAKQQPPTRRNRSLPVEAAVQYGLLDEKYQPTDLTRRLAPLPRKQMIDEFARHILLRCGGLRVVEGAQQMVIEGRKITGDTLAQYLSDQGFKVIVHNTAVNSLRMWLAEAGVFGDGGEWRVSEARKAELLGLSDDQIAALVGLNEEQRAFVLALCRIDPQGDIPAASIRQAAIPILGRSFGQESLPKSVLEPLKQAGLIEYRTGGTAGGKSAVLRTMPRFRAEVLEPFVTETVKSMDAALTAYFKKRPGDIYQELDSGDTFKKGQALEAFAIYVMRLLGLRFAQWRKRSADTTGRAEIDAVMTATSGLVPTVWQVQCKNTPAGNVDLEDVAKEVGLVPLTRATHILVLANCKITADARTYAAQVMRQSSTVIYLLDSSDFAKIRKDPAHLSVVIREQADLATRLKHEEAVRVMPKR